MLIRKLKCLSIRWTHSVVQKSDLQRMQNLGSVLQTFEPEEFWKKRLKLREPILQRDEVLATKNYYAPEWELDKKPNKDDGFPNPLKNYGTTPEKWEYYNKVVWPPNYVVPETGLPKLREVFHCRESVHFSPKRMWQACELVWRRNVDEAITQLQFQQLKSCKILSEVLSEAKERAVNEFHIEFPSDMHVAEAFPIQCNIIKGARRHAHEKWCTIRYRYINIFVRLEEMVNVKKGVLVTCDPAMRQLLMHLDESRTLGSKFIVKMVNVKKGVLVTCDPAMRQLLMHLDESRTLGSKFIVKELDETHLFIDREIVKILEEKLDQLMEQMNPEMSDK
ncbi:REX1 DNA Repair [Dictyocaulus viviparus]|uniref:REX1 DNA Repair n=1 Tax=Dictyocaulus viviparus TaxID=29172 RepID=A0A0D8XFU7_DICVI|nr:REX1 DNA Repair [Dictyocaulus viviparus]